MLIGLIGVAELEVLIEPSSGELQPVQELSVQVTLIPRKEGPLELLIGCDVDGMHKPLACCLYGEVMSWNAYTMC